MLPEPTHSLPPELIARYRLHLLQLRSAAIDLALPEHGVRFLRQQISPLYRLTEHLGVLFVDNAMLPIAYSLPYVGNLTRTDVDHAVLLGPGAMLQARALILFHHRPDTMPRITRGDLQLARRVRNAGEVLRLRLLDVLLTDADNHWTSLKRSGPLEFYNLGANITPVGVDGRIHVKPKYRNPECPEETWSGRGKMATWLRVKIDEGAELEDFRVED